MQTVCKNQCNADKILRKKHSGKLYDTNNNDNLFVGFVGEAFRLKDFTLNILQLVVEAK